MKWRPTPASSGWIAAFPASAESKTLASATMPPMGIEVFLQILLCYILRLEGSGEMASEDGDELMAQVLRQVARIFERHIDPRDLAMPGYEHRLGA
jgi:hypothetical protein